MELLIKFDDQSASFTNGVEFGRIIAKMDSGYLEINNSGFPIHKANIGVVKKACVVYGYVPMFSNVTCLDDSGEPLKDDLGVVIEFDEWINFLAKKLLSHEN